MTRTAFVIRLATIVITTACLTLLTCGVLDVIAFDGRQSAALAIISAAAATASTFADGIAAAIRRL